MACRRTGGAEHPRLRPTRGARRAAGACPQVRCPGHQASSQRPRGLVSSVLRESRGDAAPVADWHRTGKRPGVFWDTRALSGRIVHNLEPQQSNPKRAHQATGSRTFCKAPAESRVRGNLTSQSPAVPRTSHLPQASRKAQINVGKRSTKSKNHEINHSCRSHRGANSPHRDGWQTPPRNSPGLVSGDSRGRTGEGRGTVDIPLGRSLWGVLRNRAGLNSFPGPAAPTQPQRSPDEAWCCPAETEYGVRKLKHTNVLTSKRRVGFGDAGWEGPQAAMTTPALMWVAQ